MVENIYEQLGYETCLMMNGFNWDSYVILCEVCVSYV